jgi:hypothetical protein
MSETRARRRRVVRIKSDTNLERNARVLLRSIKANLGQATFFQIEDVMQVPGLFRHIASITRYNNIREACNLLIDHGDLVRLTRTDIALPRQARSYQQQAHEHPLHEEYLDTIRQLVQEMPRGQPFGVMDVVGSWQSDGHLSVNSKRVAVRHAMTRLVKEKVCRRRNEYEFSV